MIIFGTIYGVNQQQQRQSANYPQIAYAIDAANSLNVNAPYAQIVKGKVNLNQSLAPFINIYSLSGQPLAGNGYLNGSLALFPYGALTASNNKYYSAVSWQPTTQLRFAAVTVKANHYYVVSARSLKIVEQNETSSFHLSLYGGILASLVLIGGFLINSHYKYPK